MNIARAEKDLARLIDGKSDEEKVMVPVWVVRDFLVRMREEVLTSQGAADRLGVSRPFLIKLAEKGELPFEMVGTHRRFKESDVLSWKANNRELRLQSLRKLAALDEELDLNQLL